MLTYPPDLIGRQLDGTTYSVSVTMNGYIEADQNNGMGVIFGYEDEQNYFVARWTKVGTQYTANDEYPGYPKRLTLIRVQNGSAEALAATVLPFDTNGEHTMKVTVNGNGITVCHDGVAKLNYGGAQPQLRQFGLYTFDNDNGVTFDDVDVRCEDCTASFDHYAISHSGQGITCEAEPVTFTAHTADHSVATPPAGTQITLGTTPAIDGWYDAGGNAVTGYTFDGATNAVTLYARETSVVSGIDIDVDDGTATDPDDGGAEDPPLDFADAALRFYADGVASAIGTQIAGKPSNVAPGSQALTLRAVQTGTDTGACEARVTGSQSVELAYTCEDPAGCASDDAVTLTGLDGGGTAAIADNPSGVVGDYQAVDLVFDGNGIARFTFTDYDVGQIQLHGRLNLPADGPDPAATLTGSSNPFIVRPFGYHVVAVGNPGATDASGPKYVAAGADFTVQATAVAWQAGDDGDNDGIPDGHDDTDPTNNADLSDNAATPAYGGESTGTAVALATDLIDPSGGHHPGLTGTPTVSAFTNGAGSTTVQYPEVGVIGIAGTNTNYLGSAGPVYGRTSYVGRFYADHFDVALTVADFASADNGFTYLGQPFQYGTAPDLTVTARGANGALLENYEGDYWKLGTEVLEGSSGTYFQYTDNAGVATSTLSAPDTAVGFGDTSDVDGNAVVSAVHAGEDFQYSKPNTPIVPFDADVSLTVEVTDSDGATGSTTQDGIGFVSDSDLGTGNPLNTTDDKLLRYGRLALFGAYGSELQDLDLPLAVQYYDDVSGGGQGFVVNTDDTGTALAAADFILVDPDAGDALVPADSGIVGVSLSGGRGTVTLDGPGDGNDGPLTVVACLDADPALRWGGACTTASADAGLPWLVDTWDSTDQDADGDTTDDNPDARATFGIYGGDQHHIYLREQY